MWIYREENFECRRAVLAVSALCAVSEADASVCLYWLCRRGCGRSVTGGKITDESQVFNFFSYICDTFIDLMLNGRIRHSILHISKDEIMTKREIDYVTSVIGALALRTGQSCSSIYKKLQSAGILKDYLIAAYDVLHTFSLEYVAEDVIKLMQKKGYALC